MEIGSSSSAVGALRRRIRLRRAGSCADRRSTNPSHISTAHLGSPRAQKPGVEGARRRARSRRPPGGAGRSRLPRWQVTADLRSRRSARPPGACGEHHLATVSTHLLLAAVALNLAGDCSGDLRSGSRRRRPVSGARGASWVPLNDQMVRGDGECPIGSSRLGFVCRCHVWKVRLYLLSSSSVLAVWSSIMWA